MDKDVPNELSDQVSSDQVSLPLTLALLFFVANVALLFWVENLGGDLADYSSYYVLAYCVFKVLFGCGILFVIALLFGFPISTYCDFLCLVLFVEFLLCPRYMYLFMQIAEGV